VKDETAAEHMGNAAQLLVMGMDGSRTQKKMLTVVLAAMKRLDLALVALNDGNVGTRKKIRNPILAIVNPPPRPIATAVYEIHYRHADDGDDWFHIFDTPENVKATVLDKSHVLLYGAKAPIVGMFPPGK
jgi:hypothetical protein